MEKSIKLKGVVSSISLGMNGESIVIISAPQWTASPQLEVGPSYTFEPGVHVTLRASDLGNPPLGATVEVTVKLS